jgi:hypothetical protein
MAIHEEFMEILRILAEPPGYAEKKTPSSEIQSSAKTGFEDPDNGDRQHPREGTGS